ncbi:MAG: tRNA (N6-isopentenyl adenosine(37)-C2)-methylthiotransferase MiaB [Phycisphaerales bacterium]|nr:tRNA (N6-isopentenyl adenosine(37)-C2)-methylthiotransferase MiaB [Phycisphaerales bacterium]
MTDRPTSYYLETFGCQMNVLDSQLISGQLRQMGLGEAQDARSADVILFNTCSVRQHAEDKVLSRLGELRHHKRKRPETVIGVVGCMAEREKQGLFMKAPHVDLLCGPGELNQLPELLREVWERHEKVTALAGSLSRRTEVLARAMEYDSLEALDLSRMPGPDESVLQSYIRVQRGCDKFCTYCVVPFTRGAERSRPPDHIVQEARRLAELGCREITLLGQTVNSYVHQEEGQPVRFAKLLERVAAVEGIDRVRFVTSFPADWDDDIFRAMRDTPKLCPYLHIPAQSGSDRVLKRMRRTYTVAEYLTLMDKAREFLPNVSLAGDFIVGFCGETDAEFRETIDLVRRVEYKNIFVFKYSPRPGTAADRNLEDDVSWDVKGERNRELLAVQSEISLRQKNAMIDQTVEILVEGFSKVARRRMAREGADAAEWQPSEQDRGQEVLRDTAGAGAHVRAPRTGQLVGRTPGDQIVVFDGDESQIGAIVATRIESVTPLTLFGRFEHVVSPRRAPRPEPRPLDERNAHAHAHHAGRVTLSVIGGQSGCESHDRA